MYVLAVSNDLVSPQQDRGSHQPSPAFSMLLFIMSDGSVHSGRKRQYLEHVPRARVVSQKKAVQIRRTLWTSTKKYPDSNDGRRTQPQNRFRTVTRGMVRYAAESGSETAFTLTLQLEYPTTLGRIEMPQLIATSRPTPKIRMRMS